MQVVDRVTSPPDQMVRCAGGHALAERVGDCFVIHHKGRKLIVREIVVIQCETCGRAWKPGEGE